MTERISPEWLAAQQRLECANAVDIAAGRREELRVNVAMQILGNATAFGTQLTDAAKAVVLKYLKPDEGK